jgi:lipid II:glycine glycyltransferase (peptidoglycan interpeptide bridge formation enzyme)
MNQHIIQSAEWGRFKTEYGTPAYTAGGIQYTRHAIPLTDYFFAYAPRISSFDIKWDALRDSLTQNSVIAINFDVPNILKGSKEEERALKTMHEQGCVKAPRDTFAKYNILLDLTKSEEQLLAQMHHKHRYNLRYAQKHGVTVEYGETLEDFENFYSLLAQTAERQKYYIHPKSYYEKLWKLFKPLDMVHILTAMHENQSIASWMFFTHKDVLYYPYGGSDEKAKNLQASTLLAWEAIKLGKSLDCKMFDMWGAAQDPENTKDPWYGFTNFKIRFGGQHVQYMDSYDLPLRRNYYKAFNTANDLRWTFLRFLKKF